MYLLDELIDCKNRSDRIEIFPFYDCHIGKRNCAETAIKKQVQEILRRSEMPNRHVRVLFGGDQINAINTADVRRFDFAELADWLAAPTEQEIAEANGVQDIAKIVRAKLGDMVNQEVTHAAEIFAPIKHLTLGALTGNHEKSMRTRQNVDVHQALCDRLSITNLTDEALIRVRGRIEESLIGVVKIYLRHGYGAGRTPGAEPNKIRRMVAEWEEADVCLTGHSHSYCLNPPKAVAMFSRGGELPKRVNYRYRFGANPGCWLYSHQEGVGSYESGSCYEAKPMMTLKIVIWPFWSTHREGAAFSRPKIELREYPIL